MADQKISELTALTGANLADVDAFAVVDTSAVQTKKITYAELKTALDTGTGFVRITGDTMTGALVVNSTVTSTGNITAGSSTSGVVTVGSANGFEMQKSGVNAYINQSDSGPIIVRMGSGYSEKLRLTSTGNLGLGGTPATNTKLLVKAGTNLNLEVENSSSNLRLSALNDARSANVGMQFASSAFEFLTGAATFGGEVSIAPASGTAKVRLTSQGSGSEVFTLNGQIPGVANGGFAIRNETDSRNDFMIDAAGASTFAGTVTSTGLNVTSNTPVLTFIESDQSNKQYQIGSFGAAFSIYDASASAFRVVVDTSGRVGIGGGANANWRNDASDTVLQLGTEATLHSDANVTTELWNNAYVNNSDQFKNISTRGSSRYMQYEGNHRFFTAASASAGSTISMGERLRITDAGTVLIGKTSSSFSTVGQEFRTAGVTILGRDGGEPLTLNRITSDGGILSLRKDNTVVGSIGSTSGSMYIEGNPATGKTGLTFYGSYIEPRDNGAAADAAVDLGISSGRFKDLHLSGTANTYRLRAVTGSSGASAHANADEIVAESNANAGISILSGQSYSGFLHFGDAGVSHDGFIEYYQGDRSMRFGTAAGERARLNASGNLGIGTAAPKRHLHINGGNETTKIQITNQTTGSSSDGDGFQIGIATDGTANIEQRENNDLAFYTNNTLRQKIDSAGHVMIGTTVEGETGAHNLTVADSGNAGITIRAGATSSSAIYMSDATSGAGEYGSYIAYAHNTGILSIATASSARMTLDSSGNVGIGSSRTDRGLLNVNHDNTGDAFSGSHIALTYDVSPTNNDSKAGITYATSDSDNYGYFQGAERTTSGHGAFVLRYHYNSASGTERMRIDSNGQVGIGTTSPDNPLEVVGADSGIKISASSSHRPMLRFECGSDEKLILSSNTTYGAIGDASDANRYMVFKDGNVGFSVADWNSSSGGLLIQDSSGVSQVNFSRPSSYTGTQNVNLYYHNGSYIGGINTTTTATSFVTSSDYRLKENVDYTWDATTRLKQLKPARFNFIADDTNTLVDGFLAHEVSSVVPEAITGTKDAVDADGNPEYQGIDQSKLVPLLVKTIQELEARITALEA